MTRRFINWVSWDPAVALSILWVGFLLITGVIITLVLNPVVLGFIVLFILLCGVVIGTALAVTIVIEELSDRF